jgi:hypothetical protein
MSAVHLAPTTARALSGQIRQGACQAPEIKEPELAYPFHLLRYLISIFFFFVSWRRTFQVSVVMGSLEQVAGIGSKTLRTLQANGIFNVQDFVDIEEERAKGLGIHNINSLLSNARRTCLDQKRQAKSVGRPPKISKVVHFSGHSWFDSRAKLPVITQRDDGSFSTAIFPVVIKHLVIENGSAVSLKVEYKRAKSYQPSPTCYSPIFVACLNRDLPLLEVSVNKQQCELFLVLRSVWEANSYLSMCKQVPLH